MRPLPSCCRKKSFPLASSYPVWTHLSNSNRSLTLKLIPSYFTTYFSVTQLSSSDHHCHTSMSIYYYDLISHPTSPPRRTYFTRSSWYSLLNTGKFFSTNFLYESPVQLQDWTTGPHRLIKYSSAITSSQQPFAPQD